MSTDSLLPPNATSLETALAGLGTRLQDIDLPLAELWNPATCPIAALPWLAWGLSIDKWDTDWTEEQKRAATAEIITNKRRKGSVGAVKEALAARDALLELVEWHKASPRLTPHTYQVRVPVVADDGTVGGARCSAQTTAQIIADVTRVQPERSHIELVLDLTIEGAATPRGAARAALYRRIPGPADTSGIDWDALITNEVGEPLTDDTGDYLDGSA